MAAECGRLGRRCRCLFPGGRRADPDDPDCAPPPDRDRGADHGRAPPPAQPTPKPTKKPTEADQEGGTHGANGGNNNGGNNNGGNNNGGNNNGSGGSNNNNPPPTNSGPVSTSAPYDPAACGAEHAGRAADQAAGVDTCAPTTAPTTEVPTPAAQPVRGRRARTRVPTPETYDTYLTSSAPVETKSAPVWVVPGILLVLTSMLALLGGVLGRGTRPALAPVKASDENDEPTES